MDDKPRITKSERTRARIAEAARSLFSEAGFTATSVRDIAEKAACDPALVIRYFGSKEALFISVARFDLSLPDIRGLPPAEAAMRLATHFVRVWETRESGEKFQTLLRSAATHDPSADRLRDIFERQVLPAISARYADPVTGRETAAQVASVLLGTALTRYVLQLPHMADIEATRLSELLAANLEPILAGGH